MYRPLRATLKNGHIELKNYLDFTDAAEAISIHYQITEDFAVIQEGQIDDLNITPKSTALLPLTLPTSNGSLQVLTLTYHQKTETGLIPQGLSLGFDQIILSEQSQLSTNEFKMCIRDRYKVSYEHFLISFILTKNIGKNDRTL